MKSLFRVGRLVPVYVLGLAGPALAASTSTFTFTSAVATPDIMTFTLDTQPMPFTSTPAFFRIIDVIFTVNGGATQTGFVDFGSTTFPGIGGFITSVVSPGFRTKGSQLFTGTTAAPTFLDGTYTLSGDGASNVGGTMVITSKSTPMPEPASLMLLGAGLLGLGALRRSRP